MYYTLDGSEPGAEKTLYSAPVSIQTEEASKTLKAVAIKDGMENSDILEITYTNTAAQAEAAAANVVTAKGAVASAVNMDAGGETAKPVKKSRKRTSQKKE